MTLSEYLATSGLTQKEFAEAIGASQDEVSRYAAGKRMPRREMLTKIKAATNGQVTADSFLDAPSADDADEVAA